MKKRIQEKGLKTLIGINSVVTKLNYDKLSDIRSHYTKLGADYVVSQFLDTRFDLSKNIPKINEKYDNMLNFMKKNNIEINSLNHDLQSGGFCDRCGAKEHVVTVIHDDGSIAPCYHFFAVNPELKEKMIQMNIKTMTLLEYFEDSNFNIVKKYLYECDETKCQGHHLRCYN